jgi:hypothetical protein
MELLQGRFSRRSSFRWAASLGLAATLTLPALPAAAQPAVGTTPLAATAANCVIQLSVANPNPGDQEIPRSLVMNGTALDATATAGSGISRVQAFLGNRDTGGMFIGEWSPTIPVVGPPGAWTLTATMPDNSIGGQQVFVYSTSSLSGQEASVSIPIAFGKVPVDEVSDVATSVCPEVMPTSVPPSNELVAGGRH